MTVLAPCVCMTMKNIDTELLVLISLSISYKFLFNHISVPKSVFSSKTDSTCWLSCRIHKTVWPTRFWYCVHVCFDWLVTVWSALTVSSTPSAGVKLRAPHVPSGGQGGKERQHLQRCSRKVLGLSCHPFRSLFLSDVSAEDGGTRALPWQPEMMDGSNLI